MAKTFYIENLGCFKNQVDAEYMITALQEKGYVKAETAETAELIVVNTCTFIESAKKESIDAFFELRQARKDAKILMAGCMAERYGKELLEMIPEADGIFGNRDPQKNHRHRRRYFSRQEVDLLPSEHAHRPPAQEFPFAEKQRVRED